MTWTPANVTGNCFQSSFISTCQPSFLTFLTYITQHLSSSVDEKFSNQNINNVESDQYDFIVIGAGSAGSVVANRLSEIKKWKVLLLEAGDEQPLVSDVPGLAGVLTNSSIDYGYSYQDDPTLCNRFMGPCFVPRGKVMGGSSSITGMVFARGNKHDFDDWEKLGNFGWSWNDVLPYYKKSEDLENYIPSSKPGDHATGGYLRIKLPEPDETINAIIKSWKELDYEEIDYTSGDTVGVSKFQFNIKNGVRQSTNAAFIRPIRGKRPNLTVHPNSRVTKIIIDLQSKRATGVEYVVTGSNEIKKVFAKKEVVVSAGAIDSPRLLMLSGIGPAEILHEANINIIEELAVGQNLHDQIGASAITLQVNSESTTFEDITGKKKDVDYWLKSKEGPLSAGGVHGVVSFFQSSFEKRPGVGDMQVQYFRTLNEIQSKRVNPFYAFVPYYQNIYLYTSYVAPKSRGFLKLNKEDPVWGKPIIQPNFYSDPQDMQALVEGLKFTKKFTQTQAFKSSGMKVIRTPAPECEHLLSNETQYYECIARKYYISMNHVVGTCKMGPKSDTKAVVDPTLKVYGIKGLRVVDSSIMPFVTRGNVNGPTIMIGEKASDMIKEEWLSGVKHRADDSFEKTR